MAYFSTADFMVLLANNGNLIVSVNHNATGSYTPSMKTALINSAGTGVQAFGSFISSFTVTTGGTYNINVWTITAGQMKTDYAIVFGNPDTSYFLHFQKLGIYYLLSMINVSTGSLINQVYYT